MEIDSNEVVRAVLQFLQEAGLRESATTLQQEAQVSLNLVLSKKDLRNAVEAGEWVEVMRLLSDCELPSLVLWELYEELVKDLVDEGGRSAASELIRESKDIEKLKETDGLRFDALQAYVLSENNPQREQHKKTTSKKKQERQSLLATAICNCVTESDPSKLLQLIGEAMTMRQEIGPKRERAPSIFGEGTVPLGPQMKKAKTKGMLGDPEKSEALKLSKLKAKKTEFSKAFAAVRLGNDAVVTKIVFSPDGESLVTGTADGFVEVWSTATGKLRKDLKYQAEDKIMMHKKSVLGLAFSTDGRLLASSGGDGLIKLWKLESGKCVHKIKKAHDKATVNCVVFDLQDEHILSGGSDNQVRMFGTISHNQLAVYMGATAPINAAICIEDKKSLVLGGSSDQNVLVWDARTQDLIFRFKLPGPIFSLSPCTFEGLDGILVCTGSNSVSFLNKEMTEKRLFCPNASTRFVSACGTTKGLIAARAEDSSVYFFESSMSQAFSHDVSDNIDDEATEMAVSANTMALARKSRVDLFKF